jgi:hypothetical protein
VVAAEGDFSDELFDSSGQDWFFASLVQDKLSRTRGEQAQ